MASDFPKSSIVSRRTTIMAPPTYHVINPAKPIGSNNENNPIATDTPRLPPLARQRSSQDPLSPKKRPEAHSKRAARGKSHLLRASALSTPAERNGEESPSDARFEKIPAQTRCEERGSSLHELAFGRLLGGEDEQGHNTVAEQSSSSARNEREKSNPNLPPYELHLRRLQDFNNQIASSQRPQNSPVHQPTPSQPGLPHLKSPLDPRLRTTTTTSRSKAEGTQHATQHTTLKPTAHEVALHRLKRTHHERRRHGSKRDQRCVIQMSNLVSPSSAAFIPTPFSAPSPISQTAGPHPQPNRPQTHPLAPSQPSQPPQAPKHTQSPQKTKTTNKIPLPHPLPTQLPQDTRSNLASALLHSPSTPIPTLQATLARNLEISGFSGRLGGWVVRELEVQREEELEDEDEEEAREKLLQRLMAEVRRGRETARTAGENEGTGGGGAGGLWVKEGSVEEAVQVLARELEAICEVQIEDGVV
ncbi:MAG: hypothetical protein M1828_001207 [Chrysothrix sp. TS-e1954]|nr:MAG: hypothetical protein M1828_001207 [Chrysothrix sp. TS-e1954]